MATSETLLPELYRRLADARAPEAASAVAAAIERLWLVSGSDTVDLLLMRAVETHGSGDKALALEILDRVVAMAPDYAEALVRRAYLRAEAERLGDAQADLLAALAIDPHHFRAWEGLGQILRRLEQKELALKAYRQLLAVYPANAEAKTAVETLEREVEGQKI